jgi:hypothetical protein
MLVATVGTGEHPTSSARKVRFLNMRHNKEICTIPFMTPVLSVKLNLKRIAIVTEAAIHLYDMDMNHLTTLDTCPNPHGVCALTNDDPSLASPTSLLRPPLLAYPGSATRGDLVLFDTTALKVKTVLQCVHQKPLRFIQFSPDGGLVATASENGTLIKVQSVDPNEGKKYCFRRGRFHGAIISSIAFSRDSSLLCVSSNNGTVHIFRIQENNIGDKSKSSYSLLGGYLFGENGNNTAIRSFATIKLGLGRSSLCCFSKDGTSVYTVTPDGKFSQYQLDLKSNNPPKLVKQDDLLADLEEDLTLDGRNAHSPETNSNAVAEKVPEFLENPRCIMRADDE